MKHMLIALCCLLAALPVWTVEYTLVTGTPGGAYFPVGQAIAAAVTADDPGFSLRALPGNGSVDNCRLLRDGRADFIIAQNNIVEDARKGREEFAGEAAPQLRHLATLYAEAVQLVVRRGAGITCWADLRGHRVCLGEQGSGTQHDAEALLRVNGVPAQKVNACYMSFPEAALALSRHQIDAAFFTSGVPTGALTELGDNPDLALLPLDPLVVEQAQTCCPRYTAVNIPAGTYGFVDEDVLCLGCLAQLYCADDIPGEVVCAVVRALWSHPDILGRGHPLGAAMRLQGALNGMVAPLDEGARVYYEEVGLIPN